MAENLAEPKPFDNHCIS